MNDLWDLAARAPLMADHQVASSVRDVVREMRRALEQVDGLSVDELVGLVRGLGKDEAIQDGVHRVKNVVPFVKAAKEIAGVPLVKAAKEIADLVETIETRGSISEVAAEVVEVVEAVAEVVKPKRSRKKTP